MATIAEMIPAGTYWEAQKLAAAGEGRRRRRRRRARGQRPSEASQGAATGR